MLSKILAIGLVGIYALILVTQCAITDPPVIIKPTSTRDPTQTTAKRPPCSYNGYWVNCSNFYTFDQLNMSSLYRQEKLIICPIEPLGIHENFDLTGYDMRYTLLYLMNINKFPLVAEKDKNIGGRSLWIENCELEFEYDGRPLNEQCNAKLLRKMEERDDRTFFSKFGLVNFYRHNRIGSRVCPLAFKDANLSNFYIYQPVEFIELSNIEFDVNIKTLDLHENVYSLDTKLVNKHLFANIEYLRIRDAELSHVDTKFFKRLTRLTYSIVELRDLGAFFHNVDTKWMKYMNHLVQVNFSDAADVTANRDNHFLMTLKDMSNTYTYPDEDFCLFKHFPHNQMIFFQIDTQLNMPCSCTLYWLHKHKHYYRFDYAQYGSIKKCFTPDLFDKAIEACDFKRRLKQCI